MINTLEKQISVYCLWHLHQLKRQRGIYMIEWVLVGYVKNSRSIRCGEVIAVVHCPWDVHDHDGEHYGLCGDCAEHTDFYWEDIEKDY